MKPIDALHEEIHREVERLFRLENSYAWLAAPQPLLAMRIPARMLATGDGVALLQVLRAAQPPA